MKKILLILIAFSFSILFVTGCTTEKEKKVVNVLNWSSYIPDGVISDFEKETYESLIFMAQILRGNVEGLNEFKEQLN